MKLDRSQPSSNFDLLPDKMPQLPQKKIKKTEANDQSEQKIKGSKEKVKTSKIASRESIPVEFMDSEIEQEQELEDDFYETEVMSKGKMSSKMMKRKQPMKASKLSPMTEEDELELVESTENMKQSKDLDSATLFPVEKEVEPESPVQKAPERRASVNETVGDQKQSFEHQNQDADHPGLGARSKTITPRSFGSAKSKTERPKMERAKTSLSTDKTSKSKTCILS